MPRLRDLKLRCRGCGAGGTGLKESALYIPLTLAAAEDFLAGHEIEKRRADV